MNFLTNFFLFNCYCGNNSNGEYYCITLIDSNGDKHRVYCDKDTFTVFDELPCMTEIKDVPCSCYLKKDGNYSIKIDLKAVTL